MDEAHILSNWGWLIPLITVGIHWGMASSAIKRNEEEIKLLRKAEASRHEADVRLAGTMATKTDITNLNIAIQNLAAEIRRDIFKRDS